jgi:hypothetical protein
MAKTPKKGSKMTLSEESNALKTSKITPNTPSEFITAGYTLSHISDDGLVYVLKKGHLLVRVECVLHREGVGGARLAVSSVSKVP